jgi:hypothetical protein
VKCQNVVCSFSHPFIMGGADDDLTSCPRERLEVIRDCHSIGSVEAGRRLICENNRWVEEKGPGKSNSLLLSPG